MQPFPAASDVAALARIDALLETTGGEARAHERALVESEARRVLLGGGGGAAEDDDDAADARALLGALYMAQHRDALARRLRDAARSMFEEEEDELEWGLADAAGLAAGLARHHAEQHAAQRAEQQAARAREVEAARALEAERQRSQGRHHQQQQGGAQAPAPKRSKRGKRGKRAKGEAGGGKGAAAASAAPPAAPPECVICMEALRSDAVATAPCGHAFHAHCLEGWHAAEAGVRTCPVCRAAFGYNEAV